MKQILMRNCFALVALGAASFAWGSENVTAIISDPTSNQAPQNKLIEQIWEERQTDCYKIMAGHKQKINETETIPHPGIIERTVDLVNMQDKSKELASWFKKTDDAKRTNLEKEINNLEIEIKKRTIEITNDINHLHDLMKTGPSNTQDEKKQSEENDFITAKVRNIQNATTNMLNAPQEVVKYETSVMLKSGLYGSISVGAAAFITKGLVNTYANAANNSVDGIPAVEFITENKGTFLSLFATLGLAGLFAYTWSLAKSGRNTMLGVASIFSGKVHTATSKKAADREEIASLKNAFNKLALRANGDAFSVYSSVNKQN